MTAAVTAALAASVSLQAYSRVIHLRRKDTGLALRLTGMRGAPPSVNLGINNGVSVLTGTRTQ